MTEWNDRFLEDLDPVPWQVRASGPTAIVPKDLFVGRGEYGLQVALASSQRQPSNDDVRRLWQVRQRGGVSPLLLLVGFREGSATKVKLCGPAGEHPVIVMTSVSQAERLARAALAEPSRHAAIRFLVAMLPEIDSDLPGVRNTGLVASHELRTGVPARADWARATDLGKGLLAKSGRALVEGLGFKVEQLGTTASVLAGTDGKRAVAVFLDEGESFDDPGTRFQGASPVTHALALAERENLPWVLLTRHRQVRLYAARPDTGVGRKGRADTYLELNLALLPEDRAGYLPLLFGAKALAEQGTIEEILRSSERFAADLASRLRERVYNECVPGLAEAIAARLDIADGPTDADLQRAYEQTITVLFRLLFVAYAEDKDLLPYRTNSKYADHSLKLIARRLAEDAAKGFAGWDDQSIELWEDVKQLWRAVDRGNKSWGVPAYNGGLFSDAIDVNPAGAALADIELNDAELAPALAALLVDTNPSDGVTGPIDFRSLSVREFGTIYEGLLESMLSVASADLTLDAKGTYVPATATRSEVYVSQGAIYFHNRSGARKSSGSYFTKPFAVEHLLDHALEPALGDHVKRLKGLVDAGDDAAAASAFFDFRCVDLAMGSGHFLTAAVDRIEARLSSFLALHPVPAVLAELNELRSAALTALGDLSDGAEIETTSLLRRQVARRCVYGVDLNPISVELARLSIWIHTFVPGLPLSFLDHGLVCGNSLTGIGTIDEAMGILDPKAARSGAVSLFRNQIDEFLGRASDALRRLAVVTEATVADVKVARVAHLDALRAVQPASDLFDLLVAGRLGEVDLPVTADEVGIANDSGLTKARELATAIRSIHFPVAFPEVFERERPGFDCILGNPPWEKVKVEEHNFWGLRYPGLRALPAGERRAATLRFADSRPDLVAEYQAEVADAQRLKQVLFKGPFPGLSAGDPDLYKAFAWRFWHLVRDGGAIGVVLPRSALAASGSAAWREEVLASGTFTDVTMTVNTGGWVFDDAEPRYTIGFVSIRRSSEEARVISLRGPFSSIGEYERGLRSPAAQFYVEDFVTWTSGAAFPLLPTDRAGGVFLKLRKHPRLDTVTSWRARPVRELHATDDRGLFHAERAVGDVPVYKGESFELWNPDTGTYLGWAAQNEVLTFLQEKRVRQQRLARSGFAEFSRQWAAERSTLPCLRPRITFRDIGRATDTRTVIAVLAPPSVFLTHLDPYILWPIGDERDEAYLLGVLCSIPLDWYARRVVENHVSYQLMNAFPIPRPDRDDKVRRRVEEIAGRLAAVDTRYKQWAEVLGLEIDPIDEADRADLLAELDADVAHLYGLGEDDVKVIYESFHLGWDYAPRLAAVLEHFRRLS